MSSACADPGIYAKGGGGGGCDEGGQAHLTEKAPLSEKKNPDSFTEGVGFFFNMILYVPSTIFQLYSDGSSRVEPVLS